MQRTAFVTGAQGFLGQNLMRQLAQLGWLVVGIGRSSQFVLPGRLQTENYVEANLDFDSLSALICDYGSPDVVFHTAGGASVRSSIEDPNNDFRKNVDTTAELIETLKRLSPNSLLFYPSSAAVYGEQDEICLSEASPLAPISPYGKHKAIAEGLCLDAESRFGLRCCIIRYFSLYGRPLHKQLLWDIVGKIVRGEDVLRLEGTGEPVRDFLHVEDAVSLAISAVQNTKGSLIVNGGTGRPVSVAEIARIVLAACGKGDMLLSFSGKNPAGDPRHLVADTQGLNDLGFSPRWQLEEGVADYVAWAKGVWTSILSNQ